MQNVESEYVDSGGEKLFVRTGSRSSGAAGVESGSEIFPVVYSAEATGGINYQWYFKLLCM